jgi:hypothetical protein
MTTTQRTRCGKVTYWRNGESFQTCRSREVHLNDALAQVAKYGYDDVRLNWRIEGKNPMVIVLSDYTSRGHEYCRLVFSRGKWPGNDVANVYRKGDMR